MPHIRAGAQPRWAPRKASDGGTCERKNGPLWQPLPNTTTAPRGSALASASTPGWNGSLTPDATRTATPRNALAWLTADPDVVRAAQVSAWVPASLRSPTSAILRCA